MKFNKQTEIWRFSFIIFKPDNVTLLAHVIANKKCSLVTNVLKNRADEEIRFQSGFFFIFLYSMKEMLC